MSLHRCLQMPSLAADQTALCSLVMQDFAGSCVKLLAPLPHFAKPCSCCTLCLPIIYVRIVAFLWIARAPVALKPVPCRSNTLHSIGEDRIPTANADMMSCTLIAPRSIFENQRMLRKLKTRLSARISHNAAGGTPPGRGCASSAPLTRQKSSDMPAHQHTPKPCHFPEFS
jgi:hypothetical protein